MSRPLRVDVESGWYHVTARGIERRPIFHARFYYQHFLSLLEAMSLRYGVEVHAYCLMSNHYHLIIRTPRANASQAIQWLNVSYSVWFNLKRNRVGHVFQGRFKSVLIDNNGAWLLVASEYLHLNPVRTRSLGLGKQSNKAESHGLKAPTDEEIVERLTKLRDYEWSSYRAYAGYSPKPAWLHTRRILARSGGRELYRNGVHGHITRGQDPERFECLRGRVALGTAAFIESVKNLAGKTTGEQPDRRFVARAVSFERITATVEHETGEKWEDILAEYGGCTRNLVLYLARLRSGLTLTQIGEKAGGMQYKAVGKAVKRFEELSRKDKTMRALTERCLATLSIFET